jgi:sterol desaturase/sphingolipid hydroxylase (fatty acid hydroxylase superfamily)
MRELPVWLRGVLVGGAAVVLFALETRRALRAPRREPRALHTGRNLTIAALAALTMTIVETPLLRRVASYVDVNQWGIAPLLTRGPILRVVVAVLLLDYGLYVWHVLTHRVPFLWRFHLVHHIDLDLDASTAIRFHFGEMLVSVPWRLAQACVAGSSPMAVSVWQILLFMSILFHHSNVRLPLRTERWLRLLIATPRLHGIHHRPEWSCLNSNWTSGLSIWDLLHGTHCWREDPQPATGVPGFLGPQDVTLGRALVLPFQDLANTGGQVTP